MYQQQQQRDPVTEVVTEKEIDRVIPCLVGHFVLSPPSYVITWNA